MTSIVQISRLSMSRTEKSDSEQELHAVFKRQATKSRTKYMLGGLVWKSRAYLKLKFDLKFIPIEKISQ